CRRNRRTASSSVTSALPRQCLISRGRASVLSGTRTPPHRQTPKAVASHSARFGMRRPTRVPRPTPSAASPRPIATESSRSSANETRRRALMNASLAGCRAATASSRAGSVWRAVAPLIEVVSSLRSTRDSPSPPGTKAVDGAPSRSGALRDALIEDDRLGFQVGMHSFGASLPSDSRLLEAAERDAEVRLEGVMADGSRADSPGDRIGAFRIVRENGRVQAVDRVVRYRDCLLLALRRNDAEHRAEDLLARDGRAIVDIPKHGRLDEVASIEMRRATATAREASTLLASHGDIRLHTIALARHRQRSHLGRCIEGVTDLHLAEAARERIDEGIVSTLAHDQASQGRADLPGEEPRALRKGLRCFVDVVVVQNDSGRLAAELQGETRDALAADGPDASARGGRSGQAHLVDPGIAYEPLRDLPVRGDEVEDACR